jgi:hypothetical protein
MTAKNSTTSMRISSIYRRQLEMDRKLDRTIKLLADHLTRVLRQNDTLRAALGPEAVARLAGEHSYAGNGLPISIHFTGEAT